MKLGHAFDMAHMHYLWSAIKLQAVEFSATVYHEVKLWG